MKDITEFLKECRVNGNEKIDTNDDSFWKLKDLLEHYKEQCNIPVVVSSKKPYYMLVNKNGNPITTDHKLPIYWLRNIANMEANKFKCDVKRIEL